MFAFLHRLHDQAEAHDQVLTVLLLLLAVGLVVLALSGKPSHKMMGLTYVLSP